VSKASKSRIRVLWLEKTPGEGRSLARRLRRRGIELLSLPSEGTSLAEIQATLPDVLLWDMGDSGSGRRAMLSRLQEWHPALPILILGPKSVEAARDAIRLGAYQMVAQPVKARKLELAIHQALEYSRSRGGGRDLERIEQANRQLAALNEASNRFSRMREESELLEAAPRLLTESLDFDRGILLLHDGRTLEVRSICFPKDPPEFAESFLRRVSTGELPLPPPVMESFENNETLFVADPNAHPRWPKAPGEVIRTRSIVISPIRCQNQPIGVLVGNMQHHQRSMDPQDVARFETFTNMVGLTLDNIRAYHGLEQTVAERTESLRAANEELQAILDSSLAAIVVMDGEGKILSANRRLTEFFGLRREDILGAPIERLHDAVRNLAADHARFDRVIETQRTASESPEENALEHYEGAIRILGPTRRDLLIASTPVKNRIDRERGRLWIYADVTKMKQAEEQLHMIIDAAPLPLLVSRLSDGKILYANDREAAMFGLPREELIGRHALEFYADPSDRPRLLERLEAEGRIDDVEVRARQANGEIIWSVFSIVKTELHGETVIVSASYDVTRRKMAEDALEKERNFVSAVLETAGALVVVLDTEGRVVRFNRACERITGYSFEEIRGKPFPETFLVPEERADVERDFAELLAGQPRLERRNCWLTRSGETRLIEWSNTTLTAPDGRVEYVVATGIDITERHRAVQKLKLYRQIYNSSNDGIVVLDADGRFVERNPIHRILSGFSDEDLIGRSVAELFGTDVAGTILRAVRDTGSYRGEILGPKADGSKTPIEVSVFSILNDAGDILYYVGIGRDITERRKAEEELRRAHDELEERVRARTEELARLNEKLLSEVAERKLAAEALRRSHDLLSRQNAVLAEFSKRLNPERGNLPSLLGELNRAASSTLDVSRVGIWMYQEDDSSIECLDLYDAASDRHEQGQRLRKVDYPSYFLALGEHRAIAAHDAHQDARTREFSSSYLAPLGIGAMLDAPIWLEGKMVGVVCHEHVGPPRTWTPEEERFAASVADFASLTLEAHQRFRAEEALRNAHDELEDRVEQRTAQLARMNVAYRDEINERRQAQEALAVRLRYEEGLAACSKTLLTESDSGDTLPEGLRQLLIASEASGVYLLENFEDPSEGLSARPTCEISYEKVPPATSIPYRRLERWRAQLSAGHPVGGVLASLPVPERELLSSLNISSILALPVFVDGTWYGFMGFLDLERERKWNRDDIRSLETGAEMVGVYLGRRRAAEALRRSEERFRTLVENANDVIFSMKQDGTVTYISPKFAEATGYGAEEFLGKSLIPIMHPDEQPPAREWLERGIESGERFSGYEHRLRNKDGQWRWWVATASVLRDDEGRAREIIGVSHDITEMKQVVEDLARANLELREAQAQLVQSEKMASLGMLVAGIAHEINTPVGAIRSMHDTLMRALSKLESTLTQEYPEVVTENPTLQTTLAVVRDANRVIENGAQRVTGIVRRLRSFARLDEAELKEVDVHEGLEDTLALIHHELKHGIVVRREYGDLPPIVCYPGRLNQVFLNLLNNARQAMEGKGEIVIRTFVRDDRVHIALSDNGPGIPPEHLGKIFDPGFTTKGVGVGTGLGLAICYQIVRDHHGEITVQSEPGEGATFTVVLPVRQDASVPLTTTNVGSESL
jgi:PAS domain S-box-containing protein